MMTDNRSRTGPSDRSHPRVPDRSAEPLKGSADGPVGEGACATAELDQSADRSRRGRLSRTKGKVWQARLAKRWRDQGLWICARSTQGEQTRSKRRLGPVPPDIDGTPFAVEAKHEDRPRLLAALKQSEAEALARGDKRPPVAVVRPHGSGASDAVVVMRLPVFEALCSAATNAYTWDDLVRVREKLAGSGDEGWSEEAAE